MTGTDPSNGARVLTLRWDGSCSICQSPVPRRTRAWWERETKTITCLACKPENTTPIVDMVDVEVLTSDGEAGASARRHADRLRTRREQDTLLRYPRVGKLVLALSEEPQPLRAWSKGAAGEEALGAQLDRRASERLVVLHDRRIRGSRANIDHIAITPGGVFVIDAKHYSGRVEQRDLGGWFRTDLRLYVGSRDCTKLVLGCEDQAEVVRDAVRPLGFADLPVRPVLCFIGAEWGLFASPFTHGSVPISWPKFLYDLLTKEADVATDAIQDTARQLAAALPRA